MKALKQGLIEVMDMDTGERLQLTNAQTVKRINRRIGELMGLMEDCSSSAEKNLILMEISNLEDVKRHLGGQDEA